MAENFAKQAEEALPHPKTPPYTGYGTEEDSLVSVNHLILKPPKRQFKKWFEVSPQIFV